MNTSTGDTSLNNPFWQYSLCLYGREEVQALCLELQDQYGANVNILLWAFWLESQGRVLTSELLEKAVTMLSPWEQSVVQPLRQMRKMLKEGHLWQQNDVESTRERIKASELLAEQQEQAWLFELAAEAEEGNQDNVLKYLDYLELPGNSEWPVRWRSASRLLADRR